MVWLAWINDAQLWSAMLGISTHLGPSSSRHNLSTCFVPLISSEYEVGYFENFVFGKAGSRRIDKGSILENNTGNSAGDYHGCNF